MNCYVKNTHGDVVSLTDSDGTKIWSYDFDAFGNQLKNGRADNNPFRYCGEYFDEETGLIYLRNRYYDTEIGRFITEDPIQDDLNWYVYCGNDPIMYVDPWGLDDYIFTGYDQLKYSESYKDYLTDSGNVVHMIYVETPDDFYNGWSSMGISDSGVDISIDTVYIYLHGYPEYILSSNGKKIYADKMERKSIDTILMTACNTGNMDFDNNFAIQLLLSQDVNQVIAPDGLGYRSANLYISTEYVQSYSGINRVGDGFILYQQIQNNIHITPNLSENREVISLSNLLNKGKLVSFINQQYSELRNDTNTMSIQNLINRMVGLK